MKWARKNHPCERIFVRRDEISEERSSLGIIHSPYAMEERVIQLISEGNTEELLHFGEGVDVRSLQLGTMSKNPKKQMEYAAVLAVSFGFRAAINGGVDPYLAYDLNDLFLQRISEADSEESAV